MFSETSILLGWTVHFMDLTKFPFFLDEPSTLWTLVKFPSFLDNPSTLWTVHFMDLTLYGPSTFGWTVHFMDHPSWKFSILLRRTVHFMDLTKFPSFLVESSTLWTLVKFPSFLDDSLTYGLNKFSILLR